MPQQDTKKAVSRPRRSKETASIDEWTLRQILKDEKERLREYLEGEASENNMYDQ